MKAAMGVIGAAVAASACCIGPVVFSLLGAGALGASAVKLEAYRPWFLGLTLVLVGVAFFSAYRPAANESCSADGGACTPASRRTAKIMVWIAAALAVLLITFPYYIGYLM
jgi:mercuric ion transport protein